jgi:hypothetical protein
LHPPSAKKSQPSSHKRIPRRIIPFPSPPLGNLLSFLLPAPYPDLVLTFFGTFGNIAFFLAGRRSRRRVVLAASSSRVISQYPFPA